MRNALTNYRLENFRLHNRLLEVEERINFFEIKDRKFRLTMDGLAESKDENPILLVTDKLNAEADADLTEDDIISARRLGKATKYRPNRPLQLVVRNDEVRNKILSVRGKLTIEVPRTPIWINEDLPDAYRRRKSMLRNLVHIAKGNHIARIDQGGINIDGKLYLPDQFDSLPEGLRVSDASHKVTEKGGLAFASEWSPFSNMHRTDILYKDILITALNNASSIRRQSLRTMMKEPRLYWV